MSTLGAISRTQFDDKGNHIIGALIDRHPKSIRKFELMKAANLYEHVQGGLLAHTGLYNAILKLNRRLARNGWQIVTQNACTQNESFALEQVR